VGILYDLYDLANAVNTLAMVPLLEVAGIATPANSSVVEIEIVSFGRDAIALAEISQPIKGSRILDTYVGF